MAPPFFYSCCVCRNRLAYHHDLTSKGFQVLSSLLSLCFLTVAFVCFNHDIFWFHVSIFCFCLISPSFYSSFLLSIFFCIHISSFSFCILIKIKRSCIEFWWINAGVVVVVVVLWKADNQSKSCAHDIGLN